MCEVATRNGAPLACYSKLVSRRLQAFNETKLADGKKRMRARARVCVCARAAACGCAAWPIVKTREPAHTPTAAAVWLRAAARQPYSSGKALFMLWRPLICNGLRAAADVCATRCALCGVAKGVEFVHTYDNPLRFFYQNIR